MIEGRDLIGQTIRLEPKNERLHSHRSSQIKQTALLWATMNKINILGTKQESKVCMRIVIEAYSTL